MKQRAILNDEVAAELPAATAHLQWTLMASYDFAEEYLTHTSVASEVRGAVKCTTTDPEQLGIGVIRICGIFAAGGMEAILDEFSVGSNPAAFGWKGPIHGLRIYARQTYNVAASIVGNTAKTVTVNVIAMKDEGG